MTASCSRPSQSALQLFKLICFAVFNHFIAPKLPRVIQCIRFSHPPTSLNYIMRRNPQKSRIFIHWEKNPEGTSINSLRKQVHMKISCHSYMWEHVYSEDSPLKKVEFVLENLRKWGFDLRGLCYCFSSICSFHSLLFFHWFVFCSCNRHL